MNFDPSSSSTRKLHDALETVEKCWLPVNQIVMIELRKLLANNALGSAELVHFLKSDPCLLAYCLKTLLANDTDVRYPNHPLKLIEDGSSELQAHLDGPQFSLRTYSGHSARDIQSSVLTQVISASTAAEILAIELQIDPEMAFALSMLSNFDLILISWNFPELLEQAIQTSIARRYSLRDAYIQVSGYAPETLALDTLRSIQLGEDVLDVLSLATSFIGTTSFEQSDSMYAVLDLSSKYGKSKNPYFYPSGAEAWEKSSRDLTNGFGKEMADRIERRIKRRLQLYAYTGFIEQSDDDAEHKGLLLAEKNTYLDRCPAALRKELLHCYEQIESTEIAHSALECLLKELLPSLDFTNGALYAFDSKSNSLSPRYQIGDRGLETFPRFNLNDGYDSSHPVIGGFYSSFPVLQMDCLSDQAGLSSIASSFSSPRLSGVLYMELDVATHQAKEVDTMNVFKTALQLIKHALGA